MKKNICISFIVLFVTLNMYSQELFEKKGMWGIGFGIISYTPDKFDYYSASYSENQSNPEENWFGVSMNEVFIKPSWQAEASRFQKLISNNNNALYINLALALVKFESIRNTYNSGIYNGYDQWSSPAIPWPYDYGYYEHESSFRNKIYMIPIGLKIHHQLKLSKKHLIFNDIGYEYSLIERSSNFQKIPSGMKIKNHSIIYSFGYTHCIAELFSLTFYIKNEIYGDYRIIPIITDKKIRYFLYGIRLNF